MRIDPGETKLVILEVTSESGEFDLMNELKYKFFEEGRTRRNSTN